MNAIRAKVRKGKVETAEPLDLPDGTEILIVPPDDPHHVEAGWDDSPEGIAAWLKWFDSLEPVVFTPEEQAAWNKDKEERRKWEFEQSDERDQRLRKLFE
jgi:hypothetical protein